MRKKPEARIQKPEIRSRNWFEKGKRMEEMTLLMLLRQWRQGIKPEMPMKHWIWEKGRRREIQLQLGWLDPVPQEHLKHSILNALTDLRF